MAMCFKDSSPVYHKHFLIHTHQERNLTQTKSHQINTLEHIKTQSNFNLSAIYNHKKRWKIEFDTWVVIEFFHKRLNSDDTKSRVPTTPFHHEPNLEWN